MIRPQAAGLPGSMVWWIPDRPTSGQVWPFFCAQPQRSKLRAAPSGLPGNLAYQGQLLEKRGNVVVEALGVGYFFSN